MTPTQAAEYLAAKRTDAPSRYALACMTAEFAIDHNLADGLALHVAAAYANADRVEITALLRSLESPVMPAHVEQAIQDAITNGLNTIQEIQP